MDKLAERERKKYRTIWDHDAYRKVSPGMFDVEEAWREMGVQPGMSLNDYGSGPCRATKWFQDQGVRAFGIATRADVMGPQLLGEPLHLTIKQAVWWEDMMREHWDSVEVVRSNGQDVILHCRH